MYYNERVFIDTREYDVDEIFYRYRQKQIIFYDEKRRDRQLQKKLSREVVDAIKRGIPFPPVYVSELQNGQFLVLDNNDKLKILLEYLENENSNEEYLMQNIIYSKIIVYVIEYINPKYRHMQIGKFIETWKPIEEQKIWNILYGKEFTYEWERRLRNKLKTNASIVALQYNLIYFIMAVLIKNHTLEENDCEYFDRYQLLENTIDILHRMNPANWDELYDEFEKYHMMNLGRTAGWTIKQPKKKRPLFVASEIEMKYIFFVYLCGDAYDGLSLYRYDDRQQTKFIQCIRGCDMSYRGIQETLNEIRWKL